VHLSYFDGNTRGVVVAVVLDGSVNICTMASMLLHSDKYNVIVDQRELLL
jgi:hypothetical protein